MKRTILLLLLLVTAMAFGQRKYAADRYFKEYAYKKSAELYETIYNKDDKTYLVISRLADSYYFNVDFDKAEKWYAELMNKFELMALPKHVFRYAQTLKSNGKIEESDSWLLKLKRNDSRVKALEKNKNYFIEYSNRPKTYINIHNLSVNTKYSDFGGFVHDNTLYFASTKPIDVKDTRLYKWNNQPYLNVYSSKEKNVGEDRILYVGTSEKLNSINSKYHESNVVITRDGSTMYFTRNNYDGDKLKGDKERTTHLKIYKVSKVNEVWGDLKELSFNNDNYSVGHPALSPDERTLYFVSDMPNGYGSTDIYKVAIDDNGNYGKPENLGATINTEGREMFPFVGNDNRLYFSSDGHIGLGALDIFESEIKENSFSEPINLGKPINGPRDDFSFVINKELFQGYFTSNRKGGKGDDDIYSFIIYNCKEDIKGIVSDTRTGNPIDNVTVRLINEKGEPISEQVTKSDGAYSFEKIDCEKNFVVVASKDDYKATQKETVTLDVNKKVLKTDLQLESLIVENQIIINPIYFDFDLFNIREDAEYELENIVSVMKNNPEMVIKIESHTDSRGTKEYNRILSDNRAKSTRDYIISRGIDSKRIESAIGYGEDQLLNNCKEGRKSKCTEEEHQKNRRSYFYILETIKNVKSSNK
ncbi:Outer membrane protein OmpA [Tenacibaculum sp. MAR_2010_89]|uniref:OmpA family protein n=1 Tax=Tenacibaculum sp. MAR_2010_89 TaxID=1250198 RepID=UPI00089CB469|nr:OmpA family protein [Tenacibaculum sp. MAR_2010_89]SEE17205.1 Outer membrane protein OmpA [Tenacibaculum sp. MAR_2010_89]